MRAALLLAALLAACAPTAEEPAAEPSPAAFDTGIVPASIVGEYRVAGIDGEPLETDFGIALSITEETIGYEPRCLGFAWTYSLEDGRVKIQRDPAYGPQPAPGGGTVTCLPAVSPQHRALAVAIDAAKEVRRTPANAVELRGSGHSVTLFSQ